MQRLSDLKVLANLTNFVQEQMRRFAKKKKKKKLGTSLEVLWLRLLASSAGDPGSIPGQGTKFHTPQLKILHAATKTC